ncbi:MAG: hypothetical protein ACOZBW_03585 [Thermodesulfobacteriota bacterium]
MDKRAHSEKQFVYENGRLYFSKRMERNVFFVLTLLMMGAGLLVKFGIL